MSNKQTKQEELSSAHFDELKDAKAKLKVLDDKFKNNHDAWDWGDYYDAKSLRHKIAMIEGVFQHGVLFGCKK